MIVQSRGLTFSLVFSHGMSEGEKAVARSDMAFMTSPAFSSCLVISDNVDFPENRPEGLRFLLDRS